MINPPCYDKSNNRDCPNRSWCKEVGRSHCKKWVEYETAHKLDLEALHKEAVRRNDVYEGVRRLGRRLRKKINIYI